MRILKFVNYPVIIFLISVTLVILWFKDGLIFGGSEAGLPFYNFEMMFNYSKNTWTSSYLGNSNGVLVATYPTYLLFSFFNHLGIPNVMIQAFFYFLTFFTGGISTYYLSKLLFEKINSKYAFLSTLFYWFNPLSLSSVWNRNLSNYFAFFALFPLAWLFFMKGLKEKKLYYILLMNLSTLLFSYSSTATTFLLLMWGTFLYITIFFVVTASSFKERRFFVFYFLLSFLVYLGFNFWWISQLFQFISTSYYTSAISLYFTNDGNLSTFSSISERLGQLTNVVRFVHPELYQNLYQWANIYLSPIALGINYLVAGLLFWTIIKYRKNKDVLFTGILFIIAIFLVKGNNPPFGEIFQWFFVKFSFLQVFRNPFEKVGFLLSLSAAGLLGYSLQLFLDRFSKYQTVIYIVALIVLIGFFGYPYWTSYIYYRVDPSNPQSLVRITTQVPDYYKEADQWLKLQKGNFRLTVLPLNGEGMNYNWPIPYSGVELSNTLLSTPSIAFNTTVPFYSALVDKIEYEQLDEHLISFSPFTAGRYLLFRDDVDYKTMGIVNPNLTKNSLQDWVSKGLITKRFESGKIQIYEVTPAYFWPKLYMSSSIISTNNTDLSRVSSKVGSFPQNTVSVLDIEDEKRLKDTISYNILKPDYTYEQVIDNNVENLKDEDLLSRLFYVKHLPDELLYPFIKWKEDLEAPSYADYQGRLLYNNGILGKRAVEIYYLRKKGAQQDIVNKAEQNYLNYLRLYSYELKEQLKNPGDVSSVIRQSLIFQHILLKRVDSPVYKEVSMLFGEFGIGQEFTLPYISNGSYNISSFNMMSDKKLKIKSDTVVPDNKVYFDGIPVVLENKESSTIDFKKGVHEIAYKSVAKPNDAVLSLARVQVSSDNPLKMELSLSKDAKKYRVKFKYQFIQGIAANVLIDDNFDGTTVYFRKLLATDRASNKAGIYEQEFEIRPGVSKANLEIKSYNENYCTKSAFGGVSCSDQKFPFMIVISGIEITAIQSTEIFLESNKVDNKIDTSKIFWTRIDPTEYRVHIEKPSATPEMLVFSELYSTGWELYRIKDSLKWKELPVEYNWRDKSIETKYLSPTNLENFDKSMIDESNHFKVNVYANGWKIDTQGSYDFILKYRPEQKLQLGYSISIASVIIVAVGIIGLQRWKKY